MTKIFSLLMVVCLIQMTNAQWNSNGNNTTTGSVTSSGNYVVGNNSFYAPFKVDNNCSYTHSVRLG
jgi:hypothetical protein